MAPEWIMWVAILVLWPLAGLAIAYVFGKIVREVEEPEDIVAGSKVSYLRRRKPANEPLRVSTATRIRRVAGGRGRR